MNISFTEASVHTGENNSGTLKVSVETELSSGRTVRLAFETPGGRVLLSEPLVFQQDSCDYLIPASLLDCYGRLSVQIVVSGTDGYCKKSDIFDFDVRPCIEQSGTQAREGEFITLGNLSERLKNIENCIDENGFLSVVPVPLRAMLINGTAVILADNTEYSGRGISNITFSFPEGDFQSRIVLTTAAAGSIAINFPLDTVQTEDLPATYGHSKTYEFSVMNKEVCCREIQ